MNKSRAMFFCSVLTKTLMLSGKFYLLETHLILTENYILRGIIIIYYDEIYKTWLFYVVGQKFWSFCLLRICSHPLSRLRKEQATGLLFIPSSYNLILRRLVRFFLRKKGTCDVTSSFNPFFFLPFPLALIVFTQVAFRDANILGSSTTSKGLSMFLYITSFYC